MIKKGLSLHLGLFLLTFWLFFIHCTHLFIIPLLPMKFNLDNLVAEYENLDHELENPEVYSDPKRLKELMQKKKSLEQAVTLYREYKLSYANYDEAKNMLATEKDADMIEMAKEEIATSEEKITRLEEELKIALLPKDPNDEKNLILEVRAGT